MARIPRRIAGIGASDLPDAVTFDAYIGPPREITVDQQRGIIALHDGVTAGGHRFRKDDDAFTPALAANTMLVDNAAGTARETKTFAEVRYLLDVANVESREDAEASSFPSSLNYIRTAGRFLPDGIGAALYARGVTLTPGGFEASDGKFFDLVDRVRDLEAFGVKPGGDASDNYARIMEAYDSLPDTGGVLLLPRASADFIAFDTPIVFGDGDATQASTKQNIALIGFDTIGNNDQLQFPAQGRDACRLVYTGSATTDPLLFLKGPMAVKLKGFTLDGNLEANGQGIFAQHLMRSEIEDVFVYRTKLGIRSFAIAGVDVVSGGDADNAWRRIHVSNVLENATVGWDIGNDELPDGLCTSRNIYEQCNAYVSDHVDSTALCLRGADNNVFMRCMWYVHGERSGYAMAIIPPGPSIYKHLPYENTFIDCNPIGRIYFDPTWDVDNLGSQANCFFPLAFGDATDPTRTGSAHGGLPDQNGMFGFDTRGYMFGKPLLESFSDGVMSSHRAAIWKRRSLVSITNTTVPTSFVNKVIAGNLLRARRSSGYNDDTEWYYDRQLDIRASGSYSNTTGGDVALRIYALFGGTVVFDTTVLVVSSAEPRSWTFKGELSCLEDGSEQEFSSTFQLNASGSDGSTAAYPNNIMVQRKGGITEDLAVDNNLFVIVEHGMASASIALNCRTATVEMV